MKTVWLIYDSLKRKYWFGVSFLDINQYNFKIFKRIDEKSNVRCKISGGEGGAPTQVKILKRYYVLETMNTSELDAIKLFRKTK